mmetsp:Transcript_13887/g.34289  ORF Transcript_13887/g.34289 Transcript_13887/m.34289 type:complete len:347 (-) Transcript_13887:508-1548(-)
MGRIRGGTLHLAVLLLLGRLQLLKRFPFLLQHFLEGIHVRGGTVYRRRLLVLPARRRVALLRFRESARLHLLSFLFLLFLFRFLQFSLLLLDLFISLPYCLRHAEPFPRFVAVPIFFCPPPSFPPLASVRRGFVQNGFRLFSLRRQGARRGVLLFSLCRGGEHRRVQIQDERRLVQEHVPHVLAELHLFPLQILQHRPGQPHALVPPVSVRYDLLAGKRFQTLAGGLGLLAAEHELEIGEVALHVLQFQEPLGKVLERLVAALRVRISVVRSVKEPLFFVVSNFSVGVSVGGLMFLVPAKEPVLDPCRVVTVPNRSAGAAKGRGRMIAASPVGMPCVVGVVERHAV